MLKVLSSILCDLDPKVKALGQKAGICDGVPSTSALIFFYFACSKFIAIQDLIILWSLAVYVVDADFNTLDEIVPVSTTAKYKLAETVLLTNHNIQSSLVTSNSKGLDKSCRVISSSR